MEDLKKLGQNNLGIKRRTTLDSTPVYQADYNLLVDAINTLNSTSIPYLGATTNIDLGSKDLVTTGKITTGNINCILPEYEDNTAAVAAGLRDGDFYHTSGVVMVTLPG